jgi:hypothetical protein
MRPIDVMYSDMIEKFCGEIRFVTIHLMALYISLSLKYLILIERIHVQCIKGIGWWAMAFGPFLHRRGIQIVWSINIAMFPISGLKSLQRSALLLLSLAFEEF